MKREPSKSKLDLPRRAPEHKFNGLAAPSDNHYTVKLLFSSCKLYLFSHTRVPSLTEAEKLSNEALSQLFDTIAKS